MQNNTYTTVIDYPYDEKIHGVFEGEFEKQHFKSKFKWDDFQLHAYQAIKRGDNVLIVAPTSSGKTSVAEYATLFNLLNNNGKVVYTTPTKSLSNEKFSKMKEILEPYGIMPGLLTGDQKINIDSRFLIMTAEILSNALFMSKEKDEATKHNSITETEQKNNFNINQYELDRDFINSIICVIMDEIHFISDISRGYVWENTLILLKPAIQLVGLSATIATPEEFASWIGRIKKKNIVLIKKYDRPIPLKFTIYDGEKLNVILDENGNYNSGSFQNALSKLKTNDSKSNIVVSLNNFIRFSKEKNLLQLCFIVFSKKNCEKFAESITVSLSDGKESSLAIRELERKMGIHLKSYSTMPRYQQIKSLIEKGVCFHHAGIPVVMKEVVEHLFKSNHIKVLFATETVAIGVNMPIRTLILTSVEKSSGTRMQPLNAAEFKQICGRAGRRGLDDKGNVVFLPLYESLSELHVRNELLYGPMPKIESRMELTCHSYLKLLQSNIMDKNDFYSNSLLSVNNSKIITNLTTEINTLTKKKEFVENEIKTYINENRVSETNLQEVKVYITKKPNDNNSCFHVKLSKQQLKQQKKNQETVNLLISSHKKLYDLLIEFDKLEKELSNLTSKINECVTYKDDRFDRIAKFLEETEYIEINDSNIYSVTEYGKMASFINECNPFILTEIFSCDILQKLNPVQIACFLSTLTDKIVSTNKVEILLSNITVMISHKCNVHLDKIIIDAIKYIEERISNYTSLEEKMGLTSENGYWELSYDYLELTHLWVSMDLTKEDHSRILTKLYQMEEYEGSFIKNMLKINNIINNLILLCNLTQNLMLLPVLQEVERLLVKGMVNVDSLHVSN
jgi:superfamily II RNA helicase